VPDEVAQLIASRVKANIREIEACLTRMIAFCALSGREMSAELAQEALADLWDDEAKIVTIEHIQRAAAEFFGVNLSGLRAQDRTRAVAFPRQVAMYLARQLTHASLMEIGGAFRRQGPHHRAARRGQDPAPPPAGCGTAKEPRRPDAAARPVSSQYHPTSYT